MRNKIIYPGVWFCLFFLLSSCIENDIPCPTIKGEILKFEVDGMVSSKIDVETNTVKVKIADTIDLKDVRIKTLEITSGMTLIPDSSKCIDFIHFPDTGFSSVDSMPQLVNTRMNFREPVSFLLKLYQDYWWTVSVEHDINRIIKVKNQEGTPLVDAVTKHVIIYVDGAKQPTFDNIEIESLQLGSSVAVTVPEPTEVHDFRRPRVFEVTTFGVTEKWTVSVLHQNEDEKTAEVSVWAKRVYLRGNTKNNSVVIRYKEKEAEEWDSVLSHEISFEEDTYLAMMTHLQPQTTYQYEVIADGKSEGIKEITTETVLQVPNLNFDNWIAANGTYYPNKDLDDNYFWDSGNGGAKTAGKTPTEEEKRNVIKGSAAYLHSEYAMVAFAAGNIYTGQFIKAIMDIKNPGAELDFGRPYSGRPSGMKGYYSYRPGTIDYAGPAYSEMMGQKDSCHIYIALFDWTQPFRVNTQKGQFVDLSWKNESMIAFGEFKAGTENKEYSTFNINLQYRDYFTKPTYVLIVASASKYGDYFTGSTSSALYLDEFELVFE